MGLPGRCQPGRQKGGVGVASIIPKPFYTSILPVPSRRGFRVRISDTSGRSGRGSRSGGKARGGVAIRRSTAGRETEFVPARRSPAGSLHQDRRGVATARAPLVARCVGLTAVPRSFCRGGGRGCRARGLICGRAAWMGVGIGYALAGLVRAGSSGRAGGGGEVEAHRVRPQGVGFGGGGSGWLGCFWHALC